MVFTSIIPRFVYIPRRIDLDVRSLAAFRILLGIYLFTETLVARLSLGRYDVAWYTSDTPTSYLIATDTPHKSPLHQIWFYRGPVELQYFLFSLTAAVAACFAAGFYCRKNGLLKVLLFILITSQQNRNMYVHDGSDTLCRHLLLWSCFLPLDHWSVDAYLRKRESESSTNSTSNSKQSFKINNHLYVDDAVVTTTVSTLPAYAIAIQIVLMYWGTVLGRTTDLYSLSELWKSEWLPPQLSAVHYALSGSFAVRDCWLNEFLLTSHHAQLLGQILTASAMLVDGTAALCCVLWARHRHWFAALLVALHAGLLLQLRLPQWQYLAILAQTLWIPSHVWDRVLRRRVQRTTPTTTITTNGSQQRIDSTYKKTDGDDFLAGGGEVTPKRRLRIVRRAVNRSGAVSRCLQVFFFSYMLYNFAGERKWIPKHDRGDIGEGLRLSQYWVMYSTLAHTAHTTILTGVLSGDDTRRVDVFRYISTGEMEQAEDVTVVPLDMSRRYPSARWERALDGWASGSYRFPEFGRQRGRQFCRALCIMINQDRFAAHLAGLREIELRFQHVDVLPPGSRQRYAAQRAMVDTVLTVPCAPLPSPWIPSPPTDDAGLN